MDNRANWREFSLYGVWLVLWDRVAGKVASAYWTLRCWASLWLLRCTCGPGLRADGHVVLRAPRRGAIRLGQKVTLISRFHANLVGLTQPVVLQCLGRGRIEIGDHSGLSGTVLSARSLIQIGQRVLIGGNVRIFDHDFHPTGWQERCAGDPGATRPVVIGDDVFIGTNVIVLKGVQIGERSVIGAGSVVTLSEIPPDSLVAGNPAKIVRRL